MRIGGWRGGGALSPVRGKGGGEESAHPWSNWSAEIAQEEWVGGSLRIMEAHAHSAAGSHSAHPPPPTTPPNPPTSHRPPLPQAADGGYGTQRSYPAPKPCARGSARFRPCPGCRAPCPPGRGPAREGERRARRRCGGRAWRR